VGAPGLAISVSTNSQTGPGVPAAATVARHMVPESPADDDRPALQRVLDQLEDPDRRAILRELDEPRTTQQIMDACDLSQTTAYRKLDRLSDTPLVRTTTEVRDDGHHTTRYERAVEGVFVGLGDDATDLRLVDDEPESPDERLARLWSWMGDEL